MVRKHNQPPRGGKDEIRAWVDALIRALDDRIWSSFYQKQEAGQDAPKRADDRPQVQGKDSTK